jgi:hypothetical protein
MEAAVAHQCDDGCVCPVHQTPLFWWPSGKLHACQDPECRYAGGFDLVSALDEEMPPCWSPRRAPTGLWDTP